MNLAVPMLIFVDLRWITHAPCNLATVSIRLEIIDDIHKVTYMSVTLLYYIISFRFSDPFEGVDFGSCNKKCDGGIRTRFVQGQELQTIECNTHRCKGGLLLLY